MYAPRLPLLRGAGAERLRGAPRRSGPMAPLSGADSPYQGEMSRRDKRGRDAVTEGDGEVVTNLLRPLRLGSAEPPPLGGEALGCALQRLPL